MSKKYGTPYWGILIMYLVSLAALPIGAESLKIFGMMAAIDSVVLLIPILIAAFLFPRRMPAVYEKATFRLKGFWVWLLPCLAIFCGIFLILALAVESPYSFAFFAAWMILGAIYYTARCRYLKVKKGIDLTNLLRKKGM